MEDITNDELRPMVNRVAGCHKGTPSNILINRSGQLLKPYKPQSNPSFNPEFDPKSITEKPNDIIPVTLNELQFYAKIATSTNPDYEKLRHLTPKYFGSKMVQGIDHLLLEDFTHGMKYPCVMDLKIGKDRYYPGRTAEKAKQDGIKYPCLQEFGFCIAGIKLCNPCNGEVIFHYMPKVMRKFSSEEVVDHIRKFLHFDEECGKDLCQSLLEGGEKILEWALNQRSVVLKGSSLLFVYDAAGLVEGGESPLNARVCMIDFAHAFHALDEHDKNYVTGLRNLVHVLKTGELPTNKIN